MARLGNRILDNLYVNWPLTHKSCVEPLEALHGACCPITHELFVDPVMCADGHTYEREALLQWLQYSSNSPVTGLRLATPHVVTNHAMRKLVNDLHEHKRGADPGLLGRREAAQTKRPLSSIITGRAVVGVPLAILWVTGLLSSPDLDVLVALATQSGDPGARAVLGGGVVLIGLGLGCQTETLIFTALLAGLPLSALSFCYGMVAGAGGATGAELLLAHVLLAAGTIVCAIGVYLSHQQLCGIGVMCQGARFRSNVY